MHRLASSYPHTHKPHRLREHQLNMPAGQLRQLMLVIAVSSHSNQRVLQVESVVQRISRPSARRQLLQLLVLLLLLLLLF